MLRKQITPIIFWGALWGLEEATLGHILHLTPFRIGWLFWFPFAYFFMGMAYKQTNKFNMIIFTSAVASAIKLIDIFMTPRLEIVVCPSISILLEGISLLAVLKIISYLKDNKTKLLEIVSVNILWRTLFCISLLVVPTWILSTYPYDSLYSLAEFVLYQGIMNSLFIWGIIKLSAIIDIKRKYDLKRFIEKPLSPVLAFSILVFTIIIQWVL